MSGIMKARANRIQHHFWSWSMTAISPENRRSPGHGHHSLSESKATEEMALASCRHAWVSGEAGGFGGGFLLSLLMPSPWHSDSL